ncbi:MAG: class I SAM-dependent methyltransferase [Xanthobacteraceae bacterium]
MLKKFGSEFSARARAQRGELFKRLFNADDTTKIVDLGGGTGEYFGSMLPFRKNFIVADYSEKAIETAREKFGFKTLHVDGAQDRLPFDDGEIDVLFCSSVIERSDPLLSAGC